MIYWDNDGNTKHAHCCPVCMANEEKGSERIAYPCNECHSEGEMMKLKLCKKHALRVISG